MVTENCLKTHYFLKWYVCQSCDMHVTCIYKAYSVIYYSQYK